MATSLSNLTVLLPHKDQNATLSDASIHVIATDRLSNRGDITSQRLKIPRGTLVPSAIAYTPTTVAEILKGVWRQANIGAVAFTMPSTATTLQAFQAAGVLGAPGAHLDWLILNLGGGVTTLTAAGNFTVQGTAAIPAGATAICRVVCTNPATPAFRCMRLLK
jgi:hypothetical protein